MLYAFSVPILQMPDPLPRWAPDIATLPVIETVRGEVEADCYLAAYEKSWYAFLHLTEGRNCTFGDLRVEAAHRPAFFSLEMKTHE